MLSIIMREISCDPEEEYPPGNQGWVLRTPLFLQGRRFGHV